MPPKWDVMSANDTFKTFQLRSTDLEYIEVEKLARSTADGKLHVIDRVNKSIIVSFLCCICCESRAPRYTQLVG